MIFGVYYAKCANNFSLRPEEDAAINNKIIAEEALHMRLT